MPNLFETDERAYRACILYEILHGKSIKKAYENMKKVKSNIDFPDFEYWYYRFLNGDHDLDHDRSTDPKTFSDMPIDVVQKLVGRLDMVDRLSLRKVSRNLRSIVDNEKISCESVSIRLFRNSSTLKSDYATIDYNFVKEGVCSIDRHRSSYKKKKEKLVKNSAHWELAINDFSSFLMNPNWKFGKIIIMFDYGLFYKSSDTDVAMLLKFFKSILSNASFKIHVEELEIESETLAPAASLLPFFQPNTLKSLRFWSSEIDRRLLKQIMKMDQWKTADELHFKNIPDWFDIKHLFHAREFTIGNCDLNGDRIKTIKDVLLKSKTLESCSLGIESNRSSVKKDIGELKEKFNEIMREDPAYTDGRYNVEGEDYYFEIGCYQFNYTVRLEVRKKPISD